MGETITLPDMIHKYVKYSDNTAKHEQHSILQNVIFGQFSWNLL